MFRNQYDLEITSYSPDGNLLQIEYAKNASKNGKLVICLKSNSHVIVASFDKKTEYISENVNKILSLSENIIIGMSGIIGDGRVLYDLIKNKVKDYESGNNTTIPISHLAFIVSRIFHANTVYSGSRPFGINILLAGYDKSGPNIFEISQNEYYKIDSGTAIGKGFESSKKTIQYFEKNFERASVDELICCTMLSLVKSQEAMNLYHLAEGKVVISLVGKYTKFTLFNSKITKFLAKSYLKITKN
nr:26s proteasome SU A6 [Cryptomonas sp.]